MLKLLIAALLLPLLLSIAPAYSAQTEPQGAFYTGEYPNLLRESGKTDEEIQARIDALWEQLFYGDDNNQRVYYPVGDDMAYLLDVNNADVRSEGMSYGMMIAVQMDKQEEFNRIWKWAKTYMYHAEGQYAGYFSWHNSPDGTRLDSNPAPDGEEWFVMALFFAAGRWGNGEGIFNYQAEANAILHAMLHKGEENRGVTDMFDPETKMVVFVPQEGSLSEFTDPSYHAPHYYELWARWADEDNDFWQEAAQVSRDFWHTTAHPETGLMPDYAEFTGEPYPSGDYGEFFYADAWRTIMQVAVDYAWFGADPWQVEQVDRQLAFFHNLGIGSYNSRFYIDGTPDDPQHRAIGLIAMNATGALAASTETKWEFIQELWDTPIPSGQFRYYDGLLYFMGILHLSGNFQIYTPPASSVNAVMETDYTLRELADQANFHIGAAVYTTHLSDPVHAETLAREFNMLTPEQEGKQCEIEPQPGQFEFDRLDRLVAFAEENDMAVHGHTLIWHSCTPSWVTPGGYTREEAIELMRESIMTIVGRYKGRIPIWDVVNEGISDGGGMLRDTPWRQLIGDDYIELAFQFAHEADPDALLFYNDYGAEGMNGKSDAVYNMVSDFVERDIPIHGVGLQAHYTLGSLDADAVSQNIERLGELGLQVQITEADVRYAGEVTDDILRRQAGDYYRLLEACLSHENCTAFITWGVTDKFTWLRGSGLGFYSNPAVQPLLFDDSYQPKPAYFAVLDLLARRAGVTPVLTDEQLGNMLGAPIDTIEIPPPTRTDIAQEAPDSVPGLVYYAAYPIPMTVDGDASDWSRIPRTVVDSGPVVPQDNDTTVTFAAAADETNLYFLAEVKDSQVAYGTHDPATAWYQEDSVEFYLNATGDLTITAYQPGVAQIGIMAANIDNDDPAAPLIGGTNSADANLTAVVVKTEDGYLIEASVPLVTDAWTITPKQAGVLGFQVHLNGSRSADADRDTKLIWSLLDTQDQSYTNPSLFGQLIFWNKAL